MTGFSPLGFYILAAIYALVSSQADEYSQYDYNYGLKGYRRSELFLDSPFFLGQPPSVADPYYYYADDGIAELHEAGDFIDVNLDADMTGRAGGGGDDDDDTVITWPGHESPMKIKNQGSDVIQAFKANYNKFRSSFRSSSSSSDSDTKGKMTDCDGQYSNSCQLQSSHSAKALCFLDCLLKDTSTLKTLPKSLFHGLKDICRSIGTFFTKYQKLGVKDFNKFKEMTVNISTPTSGMGKGAVGGALVNFVSKVSSAITPLRSVFDIFGKELDLTLFSLKLKGKTLIDKHPGCMMLNMTRPIKKMVGMVKKTPALIDFVLFQGYALFTGVTKYLPDFPSKVEFAVVQEGLNIMIGTTCDIYNYANSGKTSKCDQYGKYPVLNMPIPKTMWTSVMHKRCLKVVKKIMKSGGAEGGGKGKGAGSPPKDGAKGRRKRSLVVGRK